MAGRPEPSKERQSSTGSQGRKDRRRMAPPARVAVNYSSDRKGAERVARCCEGILQDRDGVFPRRGRIHRHGPQNQCERGRQESAMPDAVERTSQPGNYAFQIGALRRQVFILPHLFMCKSRTKALRQQNLKVRKGLPLAKAGPEEGGEPKPAGPRQQKQKTADIYLWHCGGGPIEMKRILLLATVKPDCAATKNDNH
jgi:hypothetical protein